MTAAEGPPGETVSTAGSGASLGASAASGNRPGRPAARTGGVTAELLADAVLALAPLTSRTHAYFSSRSVPHAALLTGWRGTPPVAPDAAAAAVCAVTRAAADRPGLTELEGDPLLVHPGGALALDARGARPGRAGPRGTGQVVTSPGVISDDGIR